MSNYKYKDLGIFSKEALFNKEHLKHLTSRAHHFLCCMESADFSNNHTRKDRMYRLLSTFEDSAIEEVKGLFAVNDLWQWFWFVQKVEEIKAERQYSKILNLH